MLISNPRNYSIDPNNIEIIHRSTWHVSLLNLYFKTCAKPQARTAQSITSQRVPSPNSSKSMGVSSRAPSPKSLGLLKFHGPLFQGTIAEILKVLGLLFQGALTELLKVNEALVPAELLKVHGVPLRGKILLCELGLSVCQVRALSGEWPQMVRQDGGYTLFVNSILV